MNLRNLSLLFAFFVISDRSIAQSYTYYVPYYADGKYGYSDTAGNIVITPRFPFAGFIYAPYGIAAIYATSDERNTSDIPEIRVHNTDPKMTTGIIDSTGKIIVPMRHKYISLKGHYLVAETHKGKAGAYTLGGKVIFNEIYDYISFKSDYAELHTGSKISFVKFNHKSNKFLPVFSATGDYAEWDQGRICIYSKTAVCCYDTSGKLLSRRKHAPETEPDYNVLPYTEKIYEHRPGKQDKSLVQNDTVRPLQANGKTLYAVNRNGKWGLRHIDSPGSLLLPCIYDSIGVFTPANYHPDAPLLFSLKRNGLYGAGIMEHSRIFATEALYKSLLDFAYIGHNEDYLLLQVLDTDNVKIWINSMGFEYKKH